ncbi:MAG: type I restriction enzyme HsdR N-terminal domain-containing protein [Chitinophagaceae bacterium]
MIKIEYPPHHFKIRDVNGKEIIFDAIRRAWVRLTPEEWVRQNFLQYLVQVKHYPSSLIAIEKEMLLGEMKKRFDILVYNTSHQPWMMIECKAMEIPLNEKVLHQVLNYNISIPVPYLVITNGRFMAGFHRNTTGLEMINELPAHPVKRNLDR